MKNIYEGIIELDVSEIVPGAQVLESSRRPFCSRSSGGWRLRRQTHPRPAGAAVQISCCVSVSPCVVSADVSALLVISHIDSLVLGPPSSAPGLSAPAGQCIAAPQGLQSFGFAVSLYRRGVLSGQQTGLRPAVVNDNDGTAASGQPRR